MELCWWGNGVSFPSVSVFYTITRRQGGGREDSEKGQLRWEGIPDCLVEENVSAYYATKIVDCLNVMSKGGRDFYTVESDDYVLYEFKP